jgi:hypothetical protein
MSFVTSFHNQLDSFLNFLIDNYPNENQFVIFKNFINNARKINSIQIIIRLMEHLEPHKEKIYKEDEKFFLDYDFGTYGDSAGQESLQLKEIYINCTDDIKKKLWQYVQVLLKLGEKCDLK